MPITAIRIEPDLWRSIPQRRFHDVSAEEMHEHFGPFYEYSWTEATDPNLLYNLAGGSR
jgi:hypothetical protein